MAAERLGFARLLRSQPTKFEDVLWRSLHGSCFHGAKFRRQVPFDRFVVDFTCHAAKLVVDPRTAIGGTAGSMSGSRIPTRSGRRFWRAGG